MLLLLPFNDFIFENGIVIFRGASVLVSLVSVTVVGASQRRPDSSMTVIGAMPPPRVLFDRLMDEIMSDEATTTLVVTNARKRVIVAFQFLDIVHIIISQKYMKRK
jgi:hypothetical protein